MVDDVDVDYVDVDVSSNAGKVDVDRRRRSTSIAGRFNGPKMLKSFYQILYPNKNNLQFLL